MVDPGLSTRKGQESMLKGERNITKPIPFLRTPSFRGETKHRGQGP